MTLGTRKLVAETLIRQSGESARRYVDLCREWYLDRGPDAPIAAFGGLWDTHQSQYERRHPETSTRVYLHGAQEAPARWYLSWLDDHLKVRRLVADGWTQAAASLEVHGEARVTRCLLYGGRGSGKSYLAAEIAGCHTLAVPGARIVVLCPFEDHTREISDYLLRDILATEWRDYHITDNRIDVVNGSRIEMLTARGKREMKVGSADLVVVNEAQEIERQLIDDLLRLDTGGIQVLTCNPPRSSKGEWLAKWHEEMADGVRPDSVQFFLDPRRNPHVNPQDMYNARLQLGETRYRREYLGDMSAPMSDVVFTGYVDGVNCLPYVPIDWRDVTAEIAEKYFNTPGAEWILGADFDKRAGCTWVASRFYVPPQQRRGPRGISDAVMVIEHCEVGIMGEARLPENLAAFERISGYRTFYPDRCALVTDASGSWQNEDRDWEDPPAWSHLEVAGWRPLRPDKMLDKNPPVAERLATADILLRAAPGEGARPPRVYVLPGARAVRDSLRYYPVKRNGEPNRKSQHAHPADAWTYIAWRRWGNETALREALLAESARTAPRFVPRPSRDL